MWGGGAVFCFHTRRNADSCRQGWSHCLWLRSWHLSCGIGKASAPQTHVLPRIFFADSCVLLLLFRETRSLGPGLGHKMGGLNLRSEVCVYVCTWEVRSGEAGRVPKWITPALPVGSPDSQRLAFPFAGSCATLAAFGARFLLIRPLWVVSGNSHF